MSETKYTELELEFIKSMETARELIDQKIKIASDAIEEACKISEQYGIPFYSDPSPLGQSYTPNSYGKKLVGLSEDFKDEFELYESEYGGSGWDHSAVC